MAFWRGFGLSEAVALNMNTMAGFGLFMVISLVTQRWLGRNAYWRGWLRAVAHPQSRFE